MERAIELGELTLAILAGGAATRLGGVDKGLTMLAGKPLIAHVADALRRQAHELIIVANRNTKDYSRFAHTFVDVKPGYAGPLAGIHAALDACQTAWLLSAPVDCPSPPCDLAARLLSSARTATGNAFVAHDGERRQPLFALYHHSLVASARVALEAGQGVWQWQTSIDAREVDFRDRRQQFVNLNCAEDFAAYANEQRHPA